MGPSLGLAGPFRDIVNSHYISQSKELKGTGKKETTSSVQCGSDAATQNFVFVFCNNQLNGSVKGDLSLETISSF
jgi:hypothetical protein